MRLLSYIKFPSFVLTPAKNLEISFLPSPTGNGQREKFQLSINIIRKSIFPSQTFQVTFQWLSRNTFTSSLSSTTFHHFESIQLTFLCEFATAKGCILILEWHERKFSVHVGKSLAIHWKIVWKITTIFNSPLSSWKIRKINESF